MEIHSGRAPHFGGLWEASVKSFRRHLSRIVGNVRLTFEELSTTLAQIKACLNSRPLVPLPADDDGIQALTPSHFLIGQPIEALLNPECLFHTTFFSPQTMGVLPVTRKTFLATVVLRVPKQSAAISEMAFTNM